MAKPRAKPYSRAKGSADTALPQWGWFTAGFGFGLFTACLIYLWYQGPLDVASNRKKPPAQDTAEQTGAETEKEFTFYDSFPQQEVPLVGDYSRRGQQAGTPQADIQKTWPYALQAGAFKLRADADRLRGELILIGMEVHIHSITAKDGIQWHRVILGPFDTKLTLNRVKTQLAQNNISSMTFRVK